jgi:hypothetical protein
MKRKIGIVTVSLALVFVAGGIALATTSLIQRGVTIGDYRLSKTETIDRTFAVTGTPTLNIESGDGNITIVRGDEGTVAIHAIKKASTDAILRNLSVEMTQDGNTITVRATKTGKAPLALFGNNSGVVEYEVRLPAHATIGQAKASDGSIAVTGISGRLNLTTSDGAIHVSQLDGDLQAHTGDGSITLTGGHGTMQLTTSDGRITMREIQSEGLDVHTSDGGITFTGSFATGSTNRFDSGDGGVAIAVPPDSGLHVDLQTRDGSVRVGFPVTTQDSTTRKRNSVQGVIGNPNATLTVRTSDGSITLNSQPFTPPTAPAGTTATPVAANTRTIVDEEGVGQ